MFPDQRILRTALLLPALCLLHWGAYALTVESPLPDPSKEKQAQRLFYEIRCVVCQGEAIAESSADIAADMRRLVRSRVAAGESDEAIKNYLVSRYGTSILMQPPLTASTMLLWFGPLLLLASAILVALRYFRAQVKAGTHE